MTSQNRMSWVCAANGSMQADSLSGIRHMSEALMSFHPAIDEPSNITPSAKTDSSIV